MKTFVKNYRIWNWRTIGGAQIEQEMAFVFAGVADGQFGFARVFRQLRVERRLQRPQSAVRWHRCIAIGRRRCRFGCRCGCGGVARFIIDDGGQRVDPFGQFDFGCGGKDVRSRIGHLQLKSKFILLFIPKNIEIKF